MSEQDYTGSCQCGRLAFAVAVDLDHAVTCNCSRCERLGSTFAFTPRDKFRMTAGEGASTVYRFNKEVIDHHFCPVCGIEPFGFGKGPDGAEVAAINANCLDGVDPRKLTAHHYDGASS
jgi:hypothetical protein